MSVVVTPHPTVGLILGIVVVCHDWGPHPLDTHITSSLHILKEFDNMVERRGTTLDYTALPYYVYNKCSSTFYNS